MKPAGQSLRTHPDTRGDRVGGVRFWVLADDLTGAGDSAIALAGPGSHAEVHLGVMSCDAIVAPVTALDLHTRGMAVDEACRVVAAAAGCVPAGVEIYKKIDSTLRGHIGAELAALCAGLSAKGSADRTGWDKSGAAGPQVCIVAPAFPDMGRTIEGGDLRIDGQPVDAVAMWGAGASRVKGGIAAQLQAHGFACLSLHLGDIRSGDVADLAARMARALDGVGPYRAIVCDSRSMDDLRHIVQAARMLPAGCIWVGSAGLAQALGDAGTAAATMDPVASLAGTRPGAGLISAHARGVAFVVGSFSAVAAEQVRALVEGGHAVHVPLLADELLGELSLEKMRRIDEAFAAGRDIVLSIPRDEVWPELSPRLSAGMARIAQALLPQVGALICCGGDTSRAVLDRIGARRLRVRRCAEPGATLAWCDVRPDIPLIMKAGAFGDAGALIRLRQELRTAPPPADGRTFS